MKSSEATAVLLNRFEGGRNDTKGPLVIAIGPMVQCFKEREPKHKIDNKVRNRNFKQYEVYPFS
jgi:hypothetical protein